MSALETEAMDLPEFDELLKQILDVMDNPDLLHQGEHTVTRWCVQFVGMMLLAFGPTKGLQYLEYWPVAIWIPFIVLMALDDDPDAVEFKAAARLLFKRMGQKDQRRVAQHIRKLKRK